MSILFLSFLHLTKSNTRKRDSSEEMTEGYKSCSVEQPMVDGQPHGTWKHWDENGVLNSIENFDHGIRHGHYKYFWEDGTARADYYFKYGKLHGLWTSWNKDGSVAHSQHYVNKVV